VIVRCRWNAVAGAAMLAVLGINAQPCNSQEDPAAGWHSVAAELDAKEFCSPQEIAEQFCARLGEMAKEKSLSAPADLVVQMGNRRGVSIAVQQDPGEKLTAEQVYARARRSVVIIGGITPCPDKPHWHGKFATGFVVSGDGVVVTNAHVIEGLTEAVAMAVMTDDGRVFPVISVLAADRANDAAAVKIEAEGLPPLPIAPSIEIGATVYCLSHPATDSSGTENAFYTFTDGIVAGKLRLPLDGGKRISALAITADYGQGSSGGPILNEHGAVVGMVCHTIALRADRRSAAPQMTWKLARPSACILGLLKDRPPGE
jgi:serine protease Do